MGETPMELIRKLEEAATALRDLAVHVRKAAPEVADVELRREMLESAEGLEQRAGQMAEAIERWKLQIN
ncbi:MAG TPA: hypothetical protein VHX37_03345 [Acidobacteriaceae bacterium]|jgi:hypothetical protein|nr:hypothetical protein [Acidobacteriaceae bacterium]